MRLKPKTNAVEVEPPTEPLATPTPITLPLVAQTAPAPPLRDSAPAEPAAPVLVRAADALSNAVAPGAASSDATEPIAASASSRHSHPPAREQFGGGTEHRTDEPAEGGPKCPAQPSRNDPEHADVKAAPTAHGLEGFPARSATKPDASAGLARNGLLVQPLLDQSHLVQPLLDQSRLLLAESHFLLSGSHLAKAAPTTAPRTPQPVSVSTMST